MRHACLPLVCEGAILLPVLWMLWQGRNLPAVELERRGLSARWHVFAWCYLSIAGLMSCGLPVSLIVRGAWAGMSQLAGDAVLRRALSREILQSLLLPLIAGWGAAWLARRALEGCRDRRVVALFCLP